jgi:hypothetical protein
LIFLWRGRPAQRLVLAVIGVHITVWTLTFQYARYMIPVLPLLVVTGCAVFLDDSLGFRRLNRVLLFCGVFAQVSMAPVLFWSIPERFPVRRALGLETEEDFLSRALPGYKAARALNNVVQPQDKILGVAVENLRFYLKGPLYTRAELDLDRPPYELGNAGKGADLAAWHMQHGFRYVIAPQSVLRDPPSYQPFLQPRFLSEFGQQLYGDEIAAVFKISAPSRQPDPKPRFTSANDAAVDNVVVQPLTVRSNETYTVTFIGRNLTDSTWFDVRIKSPVSSEASVDLNWQQGPSAAHNVPPGTAIGDWIIAGVRAHQNETDRSSVFAPVSATIRVTSK